jgi:hypothetical protein
MPRRFLDRRTTNGTTSVPSTSSIPATPSPDPRFRSIATCREVTTATEKFPLPPEVNVTLEGEVVHAA